LKLLAGIVQPTSGRVFVSGRLAALLELGAGFHPEISGRENIEINGLLLGLSRRQIRERFDEIVRFAELEEFLDAPVKTYSPGMARFRPPARGAAGLRGASGREPPSSRRCGS